VSKPYNHVNLMIAPIKAKAISKPTQAC